MRILYLLLLLTILHHSGLSQIPAGYYDNAQGLTGQALRSVLHDIIDNHSAKPYGDIDQYFPMTDKKSNGKVWDIYSYRFSGAQPYEYTYGVHECDAGLQYNSEGDCFNKEHIWPQSYFNSAAVPRADLHQLYPTDGWVNNKRANFPFGEVSSVSWTSQNGTKLGTGTAYPGYTGKVFEPLDSFKGDIARSLFYTATRYYSEASGWSSWPMADGIELSTAAIQLLLSWHRLDPVSAKELDRNNKIYSIQNNRNPYIDHPELAECVWAASCTPLSLQEQDARLVYRYSQNVLQLPFVASEISVTNTLGQRVHQVSDKAALSLEDLEPELYVVTVKKDRETYTIKIQVLK